MRNLLSTLALLANLSLLAGCSGQAMEEGSPEPTAQQAQHTTVASSPGWNLSTANEPSARGAAQGASADLPSSTQALLFGGLTADNVPLGDTHLYTDEGWLAGDRAAEGSASPSARAYGSVVYQGQGAAPGYFLFGGFSYAGAESDLWQASVNAEQRVTWTKVQPTSGGAWPTGRFLHGVAVWGSDILIFGGVDDAGSSLKDMWKGTPGGTAEAPTVSWTRLCDDCVPARYGAAPLQVRNADKTGVFLLGGYANDGLSDAVYQWNESLTAPAWTLTSFKSAIVPTSEDGLPVVDAQASADKSSPRARYVGYAAHDAEGNLLYGGGVDLAGDDFNWIDDAWILDRTESKDRWSRFAVSASGYLPGGRESPLAIPLYKNGATQGMLFFGGNRDGSVLQHTRTTSGVLSATSSMQVHSQTKHGVTTYRMNGMNAGSNIAGYGVYRQGGVWKLGLECGSPSDPLVTDPGACLLASVSSDEGQPDAFAWLFRDDRTFYSASTGEAGRRCDSGSDELETCNPRHAFPGQVEAVLVSSSGTTSRYSSR